LTIFTLALLLIAAAPAEATSATAPISLRGTWVLDAEGKPIPPGPFKRGLQPSGLAFRKGELWSVGDQRGEYPGHLLRIDPKTGRLIGKPVLLELPAKVDGEAEDFEAYRKIPNSDYEGITLVPGDPGRLIAVTEDKIPWLADIRIGESKDALRATIAHLTAIVFPAGLGSWRDDPNFRFEGCAVSDDSKTVYLAFERAQDELPRLYRVSTEAACSGKPVTPEDVPLPFASIPRRPGKEKARLNLNDIQFLRLESRPALLAVLRDQERLLLIDLERKEFPRVVDLDLLDPAGGTIEWVSPEGLAFDEATDRLWIINDPDSVSSNYRTRGAAAPEGPFADYSPLLFEMKLSTVLGK
jgi:hypothetical protein